MVVAKVNISKPNVVHFGIVPRSNYQFSCGNNDIETIDKYKYLGLMFTEFLDFTEMAKVFHRQPQEHWV